MSAFAPEYVHQRYTDPDMAVRDTGAAVVEALFLTYPADVRRRLALDSGETADRLGADVLRGLARAGYRVTFVGHRPGSVR